MLTSGGVREASKKVTKNQQKSDARKVAASFDHQRAPQF